MASALAGPKGLYWDPGIQDPPPPKVLELSFKRACSQWSTPSSLKSVPLNIIPPHHLMFLVNSFQLLLNHIWVTRDAGKLDA